MIKNNRMRFAHDLKIFDLESPEVLLNDLE